MDVFTLASSLAGIVVVGVVVVDVALSVFHLDVSGRFGTWVQRTVWRAAVAGARRRPERRRQLLAAAGPIMIVATYAAWIGLFIVGFALVYWPFLDRFRTADGAAARGFSAALYFSGSTGTVLGFGDITPVSTGLRLVAVAEAALGFALLTAIVTYLISIVSGVTRRNDLAVRLHDESGATGDGVDVLLRSLEAESLDDVRDRLVDLTAALRGLVETLHQFPVVGLYYRSRSPDRDVETMLRALGELALAAHVAAQAPELVRLRLVAQELRNATQRMMAYVAAQHLPASVQAALSHPRPTDVDIQYVVALRARLASRLPYGFEFASADDGEVAAALAYRSRRFVGGLGRMIDAPG
jgi:hypothetical protein